MLATAPGRRYSASVGTFSVYSLICAPLMGGHRNDMAVLLSCCTAASPSPVLIFAPAHGAWRLTYASSLHVVIDTLRRRGRTLIESRPVYGRTTPLCCPSGHRRWALRWTWRRWALARIR